MTPLVGELADPPKCLPLLTKLPKSVASPVDENVIKSIVSRRGLSPPQINPRVESEHPAGPPFTLALKLPKSCAFPAVAISIKLIVSTSGVPAAIIPLVLHAHPPACLLEIVSSPKSIASPNVGILK